MFGPTFGDELAAAGLNGLPISWGDDGTVFGREHLSQEQVNTLNLVIAAHDPNAETASMYPLNRFQFEGMLLAMGVTFAQIETAIEATAMTAMEKAFAISRVRNAGTYNRDHPLIPMLMPAFDLTEEAVDAAWLAAKDVR
ncbi:hypothetical protein [Hoeflea sp. EC-HK425]|uniref:hypothetical protein n=1 Tax=Hoeflea sp. EC-HK425 TaxID=2038388 RepID=UPI0012595FB7|nr:hypothetical protein [Hoeflea sp. EC-HK425]MBV6650532.1 hypothetical protein [Hoeflea sp.]VVT14994.1 conserved hypothetical protein [Hoeflea sp. EC-HK425]